MALPGSMAAWHLLSQLECRQARILDQVGTTWEEWGVHRHSVPSVVVSLAGCALLDVGKGQTLALTPGDLVLIGPWTWHGHRQSYDDGTTLVLGRIGDTADIELWHDQLVWYGEMPWRSLQQALVRLAAARSGPARIRAGGAMLRALAAGSPHPRAVSDPVQQMSSFAWRMRTARVTAAQVLAASGLSYSVAHDLFVERFGETPKRYLLRCRLDLAQHLLRAGKPLQEVWREAGFASRAEMTRRFRLAFGIAPLAWSRRTTAQSRR